MPLNDCVNRSLYCLCSGMSADYRQASAAAREFVSCDGDAARTHLDRRLWQYLHYCKEFSPFWRERWHGQWEKFSPAEATVVLSALPPIGKDELRRYANDLRIEPGRRRAGASFPRNDKQFKISSGGSTGIPTVVWHDSRWNAANRAMVDFSYRQTGLQPGTPAFYLWGSNNEISQLTSTWKKRVSTRLRGLIPMPAFAMTHDRMRDFLEIVNRRHDVESALCFVTALDTLTDFIVRSGHSARRLRRVITGGGTLHPELRQRVLETFADEVFDMYGSRDMGVIAVETTAHAGLAVLQWHNYVEVLDERLQPCLPGETGRVYVTALENYSTALIRMDMGDMATLGCSRDIAWSPVVLKRLAGRTAEHLVAPNGALIEPAAVIHLIGVLIRPEWLKRFQVIQEDLTHFQLKVEAWQTVPDVEQRCFATRVEDALARLCQSAVAVRLTMVDQIPPAASGKHMYCVSNVDPSSSRVAAVSPDVESEVDS